MSRRVHLAGVLDQKEIRLYVNGKLAERRNFPGPFKVFPLPFMIGANPGATRIEFFNGLIDRVRISKAARYDKDFTPQLRFEPDKDTLALYYFDEGSGDSLNDSSGNNHHCKIVGAKWVKVNGAAITASVPDREAAEWVLSVGGTVSVSVSGSNARTIESEIKEAAKLPTGAFRLTKFTVPESVTTEAEKLALFGKSTMLRENDLGRIPLTDDGLKALAPLKRLTIFSSSAFGVNLKLSDEGFRVFESFPELSFLAMSNFIPSNKCRKTCPSSWNSTNQKLSNRS